MSVPYLGVLGDLPDERRAAKATKLGTHPSDRDVTEGRVKLQRFTAGIYPGCIAHGAMNKLSGANMWRCSECGVGCTW